MVLVQPKVQPNASNWPQILLLGFVVFCLFFSALMNYLSVHDPGPLKFVFVLFSYTWLFNYVPALSFLQILAVLVLSGVVLLDTLVYLRTHTNNPRNKITIVVSASLLALSLAIFMLLGSVRHDGFVALAERSKPLIAAVEAYEKRYGKAPSELSQLVPEFLPKIPDTGMGAYPQYEYRADSSRACGAWSLSVRCYIHPLNGDGFVYSPDKKNRGVFFSGYSEMIGDWTYIHD